MACGTPVIAFDRGSMPRAHRRRRDRACSWPTSPARSAAVEPRRRARPAASSGRSPSQRFGVDRMVDEYVARVRAGRSPVPRRLSRFRLGVNYWPAETAMDWLAPLRRRGRPARLRPDRRRGHGHRPHLRPVGGRPAGARRRSIRPRSPHVVDTADAAAEAGVELVVTLFTGHMSGVNWIPAWATGGGDGDARFRVVAGGVVQPGSPGAAQLVRRPRDRRRPGRARRRGQRRRSPGTPPSGRGTSATRTRTARSRPTPPPATDGSSG